MWVFHTITGFGPCPHSCLWLHKAMRTLPFANVIIRVSIHIYAAAMGHEAVSLVEESKSMGTTKSCFTSIAFSCVLIVFLWFSLTLWDGSHTTILAKYSLYTTGEGSRLREFSRRAHRNLAIILPVWVLFETCDRLWIASGALTTESGTPPTKVAELLFRATYYMDAVAQFGQLSVLVATVWLVIWVAPTFMIISTDNLATKLYAPLTTSTDWAIAHRNLQVFNAVLMRISNASSKAVTILMCGLAWLICVLMYTIATAGAGIVAGEEPNIGPLLILAMFMGLLIGIVVNMSCVTIKTTRLQQLINAQDLTSASHSAMSFRVMLNIPHVGWRINHVLITPGLVLSLCSACVSALLYTASYIGLLSWALSELPVLGAEAVPTLMPTTARTFSPTEL